MNSNAPLASPSPFKDDLSALQLSAAKACALLKVLAHTDRLVLLCRLSQGEYCVSQLEDDLHIHQPTLSQQLTVLRSEGLVGTRRQGKHIYYRLTSEDAQAIMQVLHSRICGTGTSAKKKTFPSTHPRTSTPRRSS